MFRIKTLLKKAIKHIDVLDAQLLLARAMKRKREYIISNPKKRVSPRAWLLFLWYIKKRKRNIPLPYITGEQDFYGLAFNVSPSVLIPRPATELLVEAAKETITDHKKSGCKDVLYADIATGSGCVPISVMNALDKKTKKIVYACGSDISYRALFIAKKNGEKHKTEIDWLKADLFDPDIFIPILGEQTCLVITANLPYLVKGFHEDKSIEKEPDLALYGSGADGLGHYRRFFAQLSVIKTFHTGHLRAFIECNPEQIDELMNIIHFQLPKAKIYTQKDLAGLDRMIAVSS